LGQSSFLFTPQRPSPTLFLFSRSLITRTPPNLQDPLSLLPKFSYTQQTNTQQRHPLVLAKSNFVLWMSNPKAGKRGGCPLIRQERTILLVFGDIWEQQEGGGGHCYIQIWLLSERGSLGTDWTRWNGREKEDQLRTRGEYIAEKKKQVWFRKPRVFDAYLILHEKPFCLNTMWLSVL